jgi:hypothetical protein
MYGFAPFPPPAKHAKLWKLYLLGSIAIDIGLLLGLALYGGFALITVGDDIQQYIKAAQSKNWVTVVGKITSSGMVREDRGLGVVAAYTYTAGGGEYTGNRLLFSARRPVVATEAEVDQMLAPFGRLREESEFDEVFDKIRVRPDRRVTVYYDPANAGESTLKQEYLANAQLRVMWPVVPISAFVTAILVWSTRSWRRFIANKEYEKAGRSRLPA